MTTIQQEVFINPYKCPNVNVTITHYKTVRSPPLQRPNFYMVPKYPEWVRQLVGHRRTTLFEHSVTFWSSDVFIWTDL